jgi:hypothetical protein
MELLWLGNDKKQTQVPFSFPHTSEQKSLTGGPRFAQVRLSTPVGTATSAQDDKC